MERPDGEGNGNSSNNGYNGSDADLLTQNWQETIQDQSKDDAIIGMRSTDFHNDTVAHGNKNAEIASCSEITHEPNLENSRSVRHQPAVTKEISKHHTADSDTTMTVRIAGDDGSCLRDHLLLS